MEGLLRISSEPAGRHSGLFDMLYARNAVSVGALFCVLLMPIVDTDEHAREDLEAPLAVNPPGRPSWTRPAGEEVHGGSNCYSCLWCRPIRGTTSPSLEHMGIGTTGWGLLTSLITGLVNEGMCTESGRCRKYNNWKACLQYANPRCSPP